MSRPGAGQINPNIVVDKQCHARRSSKPVYGPESAADRINTVPDTGAVQDRHTHFVDQTTTPQTPCQAIQAHGDAMHGRLLRTHERSEGTSATMGHDWAKFVSRLEPVLEASSGDTTNSLQTQRPGYGMPHMLPTVNAEQRCAEQGHT